MNLYKLKEIYLYMGEFGIRTVEITKNVNQIGEISNVIGAAHGKVLNVLDNLGGIGLGEISAPIECIEAKLVKCKSETLSLSSSLGKIVKLLHIPLERNSQSATAERLSAPNGKFVVS